MDEPSIWSEAAEGCLVMDDYRYDIGKLRRVAMERGWPRSRVAEKARISPATANRFFNGVAVTETTVKKIADALGVPMSEIVVPIAEEVGA